MSTEELKPCPFCGQPDRAQHLPTCWFLLRDLGASRARLAEAWNRRAELHSRCRAEGGNTSGNNRDQNSGKTSETRMGSGFEGGPSGSAPAAGTDQDAVIEAARRLVKAKGRYHTEQNYQALVDALRSANLLLAETFISTGKKMPPRATEVSNQIEQVLAASDAVGAHTKAGKEPTC